MNTRLRLIVIVVVLCGTSSAAPAQTQTASTKLDSNAIMGFETPLGWVAKSSTSSMITVSSTTTRTQGNSAYVVTNPGNLVTMTSAAVVSTATALAGVGNAGALFQVDVFLPTLVGNVNNTGQMQMYVNSPSRGLSKVFVGDVLFATFRPGIYNTLKFPIPSAVGTALGGASFTDLTFTFMVSSPGQVTGPYLFDNLRVHSVQLVTADANTKPPAGYGGSVDFVVIGGTPVAQTFNIGVIQVPAAFHLKLGTTGTTTIQLQLGFEGMPSFTCTYGPDATDTTNKNYILTSCTGGMQPGDLVTADWASLNIVGGGPTMKLRAQLAGNPMGDLTGGRLLPPMPTFWGDFDGCVPTVIPGGVYPPFSVVAGETSPPFTSAPSASCITQTTQANQIVTSYFNQVNPTTVAPSWVVTPKGEFARRFGDGSPHNNLTGSPPPNDPNFDEEGHLNPGGDFDAYYRVSGDLIYNNNNTGDLSTSAETSQFDVTLSGHAVVFGDDVTVLSATGSLSSSTPPGGGSGSANGSVHLFLFGEELSGGGPFSASTGFDYPFNDQQDFDLPPIPIWLFSITPGVTVNIGVDLNGNLAADNFTVNLVPQMGVGVHLEGGTIPIYGVSGGVDARVDLLDVNGKLTAAAKWGFNTDPTQCTANLNASLDGSVGISSGGGEVDFVVTFGFCPFCHDASWTLFSWSPLLSYSTPLFDTPIINQSYELPNPTKTCNPPLNVTLNLPSVIPSGVPVPVSASAGVGSGADAVVVPCNDSSTVNWAWNDGGDKFPQSCSGQVTFGTPGTVNIMLNVTDTVKDQGGTGTSIQLSGTKTQAYTVTPLPAGVYITNVIPPNNIDNYSGVGYYCGNPPGSIPCVFATGFAVPQEDMYTACGPLGCTSFNIAPLTVVGTISQASGPTSTTWTVTDTSTNTTTTPLASDPSNPSTLTWTPPNLNDAYTITIKTIVSGSVFGTETVAVTFVSNH